MSPPAGLSWYGSVGTTVALGEKLYKFIDDFISVQNQVQKLKVKIQDDLDLIEQFMAFVKAASQEDESVLDNHLLIDLASYLQPLMAQCEAEIKAVYAQTEGKTKIETYVSRLAIAAAERMEAELSVWVQRLNVRVSLLSERLKLNAIQAMRRSDPSVQFQYEMNRVSLEISRLRSSGQVVDYQSLNKPEYSQIDFGETSRQQRRMIGILNGQKLLVEFISYSNASPRESAQDVVGELSYILNRSNPSIFHVLRCLGFYSRDSQNERSATYGLVFSLQSDFESIRPLSEVIAEANNNVARHDTQNDVQIMRKLMTRYRAAYQLALSLRYVHSFGYVHQSIRSGNILIGSNSSRNIDVFLGGFERSRPSAATSNQRRTDADWRNNIYRSPERVATTDEENIKRHTVSHDIYSLGVVLLELGLFTPLTLMESEFKNKTAHAVRSNLKIMAENRLPETMGDKYAQVVLYCLNSTPESWLAAHLAEIMYVEEVFTPLEQICKLA